jgi:small subunit ribosomal protein S5
MMNRERDNEFAETVVHINRVAKVVKGGKNFSFSAVVVAGDGAGKVGYGTGKAREVPPAIQKASEQARKEMVRVPLIGGTVPHKIWGRWGATRVLLRPASPGTGVIAGGGVRAVMESAGIQDVLTKIVGSRNPFNVVRATFDALHNLMTEDQVKRLRGVEVPGAEPGAPSVDAPSAEPAAAAEAAPPAESEDTAVEKKPAAAKKKAAAKPSTKKKAAPAEPKTEAADETDSEVDAAAETTDAPAEETDKS